ncbi:MalY/PatB family protein [Prevotella sp. KH2C16]|uniref:MalY/PatB family protein n=1 Tax=Prevotella sp. KH2C16 TaxID=1855325 RepID=UPI0008E2DD24|nr:MalY/PatB family protein [Prevotella sp. KH2C16]SFG51276.1 cystathione beta-lyase [Prevotella sp. KH2C16]
MKYDFDKETIRRGTQCVKWDEAADPEVLPMWVADMDFEVAPCIAEVLQKRVAHGIFGYALVPESYYEAVIGWFSRRHGWNIQRDWILYTSGVVPAMSCAIKALCMPGEKVLIQTPVYNCFFSSIHNNGCQVVENELRRTGDTYEIDFEDFERKCADEKTTLFLLCNPHNPAGRVWSKAELQHMNDICMRHGVRVVSDEIHCELVMPGCVYTPFAAAADDCQRNSITLSSPSKSFNTAGLQIANIVCQDAEVRRRIDRAININEVCDVNPFGPIALEAAYNEGEEWLDELNQYLYQNYLALKEFFANRLPQLQVMRLEGTYLVWVDIRSLGLSSDGLTEKLLNEGKVFVNSGTMYGRKAGEGYIRINIACPRSRMLEGLERIATVIGKLNKK